MLLAVMQLFVETAEMLKQVVWSCFPGLNFNNVHFKITDQGKSKTFQVFEVSDDNSGEQKLGNKNMAFCLHASFYYLLAVIKVYSNV